MRALWFQEMIWFLDSQRLTLVISFTHFIPGTCIIIMNGLLLSVGPMPRTPWSIKLPKSDQISFQKSILLIIVDKNKNCSFTPIVTMLNLKFCLYTHLSVIIKWIPERVIGTAIKTIPSICSRWILFAKLLDIKSSIV